MGGGLRGKLRGKLRGNSKGTRSRRREKRNESVPPDPTAAGRSLEGETEGETENGPSASESASIPAATRSTALASIGQRQEESETGRERQTERERERTRKERRENGGNIADWDVTHVERISPKSPVSGEDFLHEIPLHNRPCFHYWPKKNTQRNPDVLFLLLLKSDRLFVWLVFCCAGCFSLRLDLEVGAEGRCR